MRIFRVVVRFFLDIVETIVVALAIFVLIYLFLVQPHQITGNSMLPNFFDGEFLLTDKISYRFTEPQRGDVVIFHAPPGAKCPQELQCDFVKRIVGLPGEMVTIRGQQVFINSSLLEEHYLSPEERVGLANASFQEFVVANDAYFVLGDNRNHSSDSRAWGMVPSTNIVGRAWLRYWPPQRLGFIAEAKY